MEHVDLTLRQRCIKQVVACPRCHSPLEHEAETRCGDYTLAALLDCARCGTVGQICNGKYLFGDFPHVSAPAEGSLVGSLLHVRQPFGSGGIDGQEDWQETGGTLSAATPTAEWRFSTDAIALSLEFLRTDWSGIVEIACDDLPPIELDLFWPTGSIELCVPVFLGLGRHTVTVRCTGRKNPLSHAAECHLTGVVETTFFGELDEQLRHQPKNRGNSFPGKWDSLLDRAGERDVVLDFGSSRRSSLGSTRLTLDFHPGTEADIALDPSLLLPFRDGSIALVLAQSSLNHVPDPARCVDDLHRVLTPGGTVLAEAALFQPTHDSHQHYFNMSSAAVATLFRDFEIEEIQEVGRLSETLAWLLTALPAGPIDPAERDSAIAAVRHIENHFSKAAARRCASHIELIARKRP